MNVLKPGTLLIAFKLKGALKKLFIEVAKHQLKTMQRNNDALEWIIIRRFQDVIPKCVPYIWKKNKTKQKTIATSCSKDLVGPRDEN